MTNEREFEDKYGSWNWDQERRTKTNGLLMAMSNFQFIIITLFTVMKCLSVVKPLSMQLQKRESDIYKAYSQVNCVKDDLKALRNGIDALFLMWYGPCVELGKEYNIALSMPRTAQMQQHRNDTPASSPCQNCKRSLLCRNG